MTHPSGVSFKSTDTTGPTYGSITARDGYLAIANLAQDQRVPYLAYEDGAANPDLEWGIGYRDASSNFEVETVTATQKSGTVVRLSQGGSPTAITRTTTTVYEILEHEDGTIEPYHRKLTITDTDTYVIVETPPAGWDMWVYFKEFSVNTNQVQLRAEISDDDQTTWESTNYWANEIGRVGATSSESRSIGATVASPFFNVISNSAATSRLANDAGLKNHMLMHWINPRAADRTVYFQTCMFHRDANNDVGFHTGGGVMDADFAATHVRFSLNSGTWDGGEVYVRDVLTRLGSF